MRGELGPGLGICTDHRMYPVALLSHGCAPLQRENIRLDKGRSEVGPGLGICTRQKILVVILLFHGVCLYKYQNGHE